jgi:serine protease Do
MKNNMIIKIILLLIFFITSPSWAVDSGVESLRQTGKAFASVARNVSPSVVFIQVEGKSQEAASSRFSRPFGNQSPFQDDFFKRFFGDRFPGMPEQQRPDIQPEERRVTGQGSGFVFAQKAGFLSSKTYILTNNHVIQNAENIRVKFQDGREFKAEITGRDPQSDIAVIEIKTSDRPALAWGDSTQLEVGEWVVAIGNPFGLSHTLTVGVVSAKGRTSVGLNDYEDFIQTDAAINPGNSGGPLVNLNGEVVGINTAIFSRSGGYMGVGFAIPSNLAKTIAYQLVDRGEVTRGYLGVIIQSLTAELAESFGLKAMQGILVSQVSDDSPAEKAGLQQGDLIVQYQGKPVKDVGSFRNSVSLTAPGSTAELTVLRNGKQVELRVKIGQLTKQKMSAQDSTQRSDEIGLVVQTLTTELAEQFNGKAGEGVVVTDVRQGSIAAMAGIEPGTIILQINRVSVSSAEEFARLVKQGANKQHLLLLVRMDGMQRFIALSW